MDEPPAGPSLTATPSRGVAAGTGAARDDAAAWYVPTRGRGRDWLAVLHAPYTAWHLSYVLVGAGLAPMVSVPRLVATLGAFALAVGVAAHGFDELRGRPLRTAIPARLLGAVSGVALAGAVALGAVGIQRVGWSLVAFIAAGVGLVLAYNLELWGGRFHTDAVFAAGWGAFPVLTAYYAQTGTIRAGAILAAVFALGLSKAQRSLSTEARDLRRRTVAVIGHKLRPDGTREEVDRRSVLRPIEAGLISLSWATCALGAALVLSRTGH